MYITLEKGTVTSIEERPEGKIVNIAMDPPDEGEEKCATCRICGQKADCTRLLEVCLNEEHQSPVTGTRVEVEISHPSLYTPILATLLLPLAGLVAGAVVGFALGDEHELQDLISVLFAVIGGFVFFCLGYFFVGKKSADRKPCARLGRTL